MKLHRYLLWTVVVSLNVLSGNIPSLDWVHNHLATRSSVSSSVPSSDLRLNPEEVAWAMRELHYRQVLPEYPDSSYDYGEEVDFRIKSEVETYLLYRGFLTRQDLTDALLEIKPNFPREQLDRIMDNVEQLASVVIEQRRHPSDPMPVDQYQQPDYFLQSGIFLWSNTWKENPNPINLTVVSAFGHSLTAQGEFSIDFLNDLIQQRAHVKPRVLDIGTGTMSVFRLALVYFEQEDLELHGIDIVDIRDPEDGGLWVDGVLFQWGLVENTGYSNDYFDGVTGQYALEHTDTRRALFELNRILKLGAEGAFVIQSRDPDSQQIAHARASIQLADEMERNNLLDKFKKYSHRSTKKNKLQLHHSLRLIEALKTEEAQEFVSYIRSRIQNPPTKEVVDDLERELQDFREHCHLFKINVNHVARSEDELRALIPQYGFEIVSLEQLSGIEGRPGWGLRIKLVQKKIHHPQILAGMIKGRSTQRTQGQKLGVLSYETAL